MNDWRVVLWAFLLRPLYAARDHADVSGLALVAAAVAWFLTRLEG